MEYDNQEHEPPLSSPLYQSSRAITCAIEIWAAASKSNDEVCSSEKSLEDEEDHFFSHFIEPAFTNLSDPDSIVQDMMTMDYDKKDPLSYNLLIEKLIRVIVANAAWAAHKEQSGEFGEAWQCAMDSAYWSGILVDKWAHITHKVKPAAEMARKRHAENYQLIEFALSYWKEKIDPHISAQKAANELIKVVPLSHKKLAEIVSTEKKKVKK